MKKGLEAPLTLSVATSNTALLHSDSLSLAASSNVSGLEIVDLSQPSFAKRARGELLVALFNMTNGLLHQLASEYQ